MYWSELPAAAISISRGPRSDISDPAEAANLAVAIASGLGRAVAPEAAMALAWSKLARLRIRSLRQAMLAALLTGPLPADLKGLPGLERYERAALVEQKRTLRSLRLGRE